MSNDELDDELQEVSDSSQVLQDAQSMGVHNDDDGDEEQDVEDDDGDEGEYVEDDVGDEVEGYVPEPLSEQQISDMRDRGEQ